MTLFCCRPLVRPRSDTFCCRIVPPMAFRCPMPSNRETRRPRAEAAECSAAVRCSRVRVAHRHCRRSPLCCSPTPGRASCQLACSFVQSTNQRPSPCEVPRLPCSATGCTPGRDKFVANRAPRRRVTLLACARPMQKAPSVCRLALFSRGFDSGLDSMLPRGRQWPGSAM